MGKDFGSWFHHQFSDWRSPNLKTLSPPFNAGQQNNIPARMNPCANIAFTPVPNSIFKEKISDGHCENHEVVTPIPAPECAQKRFIVFDQSGDQTTLMFSSGIATPVQCPASFGPKLDDAYDLNKIELGNDREDDEVASTGHSPGTMTADDKQEWVEESAEMMLNLVALREKIKVWENFGSLSGNKRSRKDKIRETVGVLQSIIPGERARMPLRSWMKLSVTLDP
ncbi:hypothetical protein Acr_21g0008560 [Actinidia rufa]|uniref:Uncharacterized protein n=1 Tax=Actinidia rufa TaxID=165716 RepID=A0A7J0GHH2_9ERIC|nr:hypothetical protein Acr_21g0008560 [Actinidia rufa]